MLFRSDAYVLVCEHQRPQVSHVAPDRVRHIPNGIDLGRFAAERRRAVNAPLLVGRLHEVPGVLATFDVFCHTTASDVDECHPLALLEALAAGCRSWPRPAAESPRSSRTA